MRTLSDAAIAAEEEALDKIHAILDLPKNKRGLTMQQIAEQTQLAIGRVQDICRKAKKAKVVLRQRPRSSSLWYNKWDDLPAVTPPYHTPRQKSKRGRKAKVIALALLLLSTTALFADVVRDDSYFMGGQFTDNGDSTPFLMGDIHTGKKFIGFRFVNDGNQALHGRLALYGECLDPLYQNWNCGAIDFSNTRAHRMDNRIAIIRARGYNHDAETSGYLDFFTWDATQSRFHIGMHLDGSGRLAVGNNGYPFSQHASAWLMIAPGGRQPNGAPVKLKPGELLDTPEDGALEYDGNHLYFTIGHERSIILTQPASETPWNSKFFRQLWSTPR